MLSCVPGLPFDDFQVEDGDAVEDGDQQESDEGGYGQAADLGVAEGLPQRAAVAGEREQREDGRAYGDQDGAQALDAGVADGLLEGLALLRASPR